MFSCVVRIGSLAVSCPEVWAGTLLLETIRASAGQNTSVLLCSCVIHTHVGKHVGLYIPSPPPLSLFLSAGECESICFRRQHVRPSADRTGSWMDSHSPPVIDSSTYSQSRHRGSCRVGHISPFQSVDTSRRLFPACSRCASAPSTTSDNLKQPAERHSKWH